MSNTPKFKLEFEIDDIPWVFHALTIASSTALMSGSGAQKVKERIKIFINQLQEFYPSLAGWSMKEYGWFNAMVAIREAKESWSIIHHVNYNINWTTTGYTETPSTKAWETEPVYIIVDQTQKFRITDNMSYNPTFIKTLTEIIQQIVPESVKLQELSAEDVRKHGASRAKY